MAIKTLMRRGFPGVVLVLLATAAYHPARGLAQLVNTWLERGRDSNDAVGPTNGVKPDPPEHKSGRTILDRNPFDSVTGPLHDQPPARLGTEGGGTPCQSMSFRCTEQLETARPVVDNRPQAPFRSLRFVPDRKDGKLVGLRLFGIRPGSLLSTLGLQNGDRLESINGLEIASPEKALEAYARLSTAKRLSVRVVRLGKPLQIDLNIT